MPDVATFSEMPANGFRVATVSIPLDFLRKCFDFSPGPRLNATMIPRFPDTRLLSAPEFGKGDPHSHRPDRCTRAIFIPLAK